MSSSLDHYSSRGYSRASLVVTCPECGETTRVQAVSEFGTTEYDRDECPECGHVFDGAESAEDDEPPDFEPDPYNGEYGRFEPWS